ncbi:hypothetical protein [Fibrella forsythiae]|uniref:Uncharacterized protein n=1 Tax=Fibrella forsythiae TaxID=2817061 RepID=A0ABS3JT03_9BACT|nr:hypothetical protein [Fibrella forsythiae]MBO0953139.1 hypothetical protein [Fibrella forsythiae]
MNTEIGNNKHGQVATMNTVWQQQTRLSGNNEHGTGNNKHGRRRSAMWITYRQSGVP